MEDQTKRSWRKILYVKQPYPDNYIDYDRFLEHLNMDPSELQTVSVSGLFINASVIAQQFTVVCIFLAVYKLTVAGYISKHQLLIADGWSLLFTFIVGRLLEDNTSMPPLLESLRKIFISGVCLRLSAPILQTLTSSFSDDTIHALALTLTFFHLITFDYDVISDEKTGTFSGALSLNAVVFTAVLLASRLDDIDIVVAFILLAVISFAIWPGIAKLIRIQAVVYHLLLTATLWVVASTILLHVDVTLLAVYEFFVLFLTLLCPLGLLSMAPYKKSLRGPWDEATVPLQS